MHLTRSATDIPDALRGSVVAIGNFDGVHLGHRIVISEAREVARRLDAPLAVLSFEPHPRSVFKPDDPPFRLTPCAVRARELAALGVDLHVVLTFDLPFSRKSADAFIQEIVVSGLAARHVVIGYDFCFGHNRQGNAETLVEFGRTHGFGVNVVTKAADEGGGTYSSSRARDCLRAGRPRDAQSVLGRWFEIEGPVLHGDARGRTLGYPTANIDLDGFIRPAYGVYAVRCGVPSDRDDSDNIAMNTPRFPPGMTWQWYDGVANIGVRPMFETPTPMLEGHLFDYSGDLYGQTIRVQIVEFIRGEVRFDTLGALVEQMDDDSRAARAVLAGLSSPGSDDDAPGGPSGAAP